MMGVVLDRFGPKVCGSVGCLFLAVGTLLFGFSTSGTSFSISSCLSITLDATDLDGFVVGFSFMAFGGAGLHISMMHLSNLWPEAKLVIITCLNGSFAMSAYVFLIFRVCEFIHLIRILTLSQI
jgi:hypothetical protein